MNKLMFNYHSERLSDTGNDIVLAFNELVSDFRANKADTKEYKEKNATFSESLSKYCIEESGGKWTNIEAIKNPQATVYNSNFVNTFATILAEMITPVVPAITSSEYSTFYEVTHVGWGDLAKYEVESNELFIVYDMAEGINRQNQQTAYNTEYTIQASKKTISTFVNWYHVASNKLDWGKFGIKVARSFEAYIQAAVVKAMTSTIASANELGIGGYLRAGTDKATWVELSQLVRAANNSDVYAIGTLGALSKIVPEDAGFRYNSNDDLTKVGYLPSYQQVPMIQMDNVLVPGSINTAAPKLLLQDDYIFFVPMGFNRPIKVAIEGSNVLVTTDPAKTKDNTLGLTISMYIGIDSIVGSKFGILDVT
jgi:hypothetical protein